MAITNVTGNVLFISAAATISHEKIAYAADYCIDGNHYAIKRIKPTVCDTAEQCKNCEFCQRNNDGAYEDAEYNCSDCVKYYGVHIMQAAINEVKKHCPELDTTATAAAACYLDGTSGKETGYFRFPSRSELDYDDAGRICGRHASQDLRPTHELLAEALAELKAAD